MFDVNSRNIFPRKNENIFKKPCNFSIRFFKKKLEKT